METQRRVPSELVVLLLINLLPLIGLIFFRWEVKDIFLLFHFETLVVATMVALNLLIGVFYHSVSWVFLPRSSSQKIFRVLPFLGSFFLFVAFLSVTSSYLAIQSFLVTMLAFYPEELLSYFRQEDTLRNLAWSMAPIFAYISSIIQFKSTLSFAYLITLLIYAFVWLKGWFYQQDYLGTAIEQIILCGKRLFINGVVLYGGFYLVAVTGWTQPILFVFLLVAVKFLFEYYTTRSE